MSSFFLDGTAPTGSETKLAACIKILEVLTNANGVYMNVPYPEGTMPTGAEDERRALIKILGVLYATNGGGGGGGGSGLTPVTAPTTLTDFSMFSGGVPPTSGFYIAVDNNEIYTFKPPVDTISWQQSTREN